MNNNQLSKPLNGLYTLALKAVMVGGVFIFGAYSMNSEVNAAGDSPTAIVIHGGAGTIRRENLGAEKEAAIRSTLEEAVKAGHAVLAAGGTSLDATMAAVVILEDSPLFNAGRGAVYNSVGGHELDASLMEGNGLQAGAVAGVEGVRNPILLAHKVMTESPHVMLMGEGAEEFARMNGVTFEDSSYFDTEFRRQQWERVREQDPNAAAVSESSDEWKSTVGAVALDKHGNLAAATSTGGTTNKRWGRVGDSPIVGAGTFADNRSCAVSATGDGEYFIRAAVAKDICARVQYQGVSLSDAANAVVHGELVEMGGEGGVIAIDPAGNIVADFNTSGMYRAEIDTTGELSVSIYKDD
ncbi:MAG TPA: isoaspartyl peptidase/L-asparaginase [Xanthomonadales bacterium]|nr:isoaspartyl peptidase/L-asparaginase [Xanthomonadales bacterium]